MPLELYQNYLNVTSRMTVGQGELGVVAENLDGSSTRIVWDVTKTSKPNADTATVQIYNLSPSNRARLAQLAAQSAFSYKATLEIGYDGVLSQLFTGRIWKIRPEVWERTDIISEIQFGDGLVELRDADPFAVSLADSFWLAAVEAIASQMGLTVSPQFKAALQSAPTNLTYPTFSVCLNNDPRKDLDTIVSSLGPGYSWKVENGALVMLVHGYLQNYTPPQILSPASGLLTYEVRDDGGVDASALAHPSVVPGGGVIFQDVKGVKFGYQVCRVETVTFQGDGYSDSTMNILARPLQAA